MTQQTIQKFFPFSSDYMSWDDWNGNVAIIYGELNVPFTTEENWKITAQLLSSNTALSEYPIPSPESYENWQDWADQFTQSINGQSY